jgi:hypothetical protein
MKLAKEIQRESLVLRDLFKNNSYLRELEQFYTEMLNKGLIKKQEYNLPLPDTVGANFHLQHFDK